MIMLERKDGQWFNLASGQIYSDQREGLLVTLSDGDMIMVKGWSRVDMLNYTGGLIVRPAEWRFYPDGNYVP